MIFCHCGESSEQDICEPCLAWGIAREDVFPTFSEQFHRIGKGGKRYWHTAGAGILFTDGKSILLLKRKAPSDNPGTWGIPGGGAKKGETPIATAWRETKEECGANKQGYQFEKYHQKDGHHNFYVFLYRVPKPFDCTLTNEHSDAKWISINDLDKYELHPKMAENVATYKRAILKRWPNKSFSEWVTTKKTLDGSSESCRISRLDYN